MELKLTAKDYKSHVKPTWCPGCGDFGLNKAIQVALADLQVPPHNVAIISGIGCSSNLPHFNKTYGFHSIHGRALAVATGVHLGNHEIVTLVAGGDGDGYGIGGNHFVHSCIRNMNITYMVMNNSIYGLTTGQASPTTLEGTVTKSTPPGYEVHEHPLNPISLALTAGATFVARGFSGEGAHLTELIKKAIQHKGSAFIDVLSPCVTWQKQATYEFYRERVYKLEDEGHDPSDFMAAFQKSLELERVPIGLFYQTQRPTYVDHEPALKKGPLAHQKGGLKTNDPILKEFF